MSDPTTASSAADPSHWLARLGRGRRVLIVVAAPKEGDTVAAAWGAASPDSDWCAVPIGVGVDLVRSGVGPANAAGCAAACFDPDRHAGLVSAGIAGALPASTGGYRAAIGDVVVGSVAAFADAGLRTPEGFTTQAAMGFPHVPAGAADGSLLPDTEWLGEVASAVHGTVAPIATVSAASGTDASAVDVAARTGAVVEAMEGAGVLLVGARLGVPSIEVRTVSNTTGDRARQRWDLGAGLSALARVLGPVSA